MADQAALQTSFGSPKRRRTIKMLRILLWGSDHWVVLASMALGALVVTPFLAPVFMRLGWTSLGGLIYTLYSTLCHQMAQRSFFLFGPQAMYNVSQLPVSLTGRTVADMWALRAFVGSPEIGWKVAWSDRMVYMFGGMWLLGIYFGWLRHRRQIRPLSPVQFGLLLLPMAVDGVTHLLSDANSGLLGGFRYSNSWLANLTGNSLPTWFYVGDVFGSFNSWMRLISGLTFAWAVVWLLYPYLNLSITDTATTLRAKLMRAETLSSPAMMETERWLPDDSIRR